MANKHAIVFGASGVCGWAVTSCLLNGYPSPDAFQSVTAVTNRPLECEDALWPKSDKLDLVTGVDLLTPDRASLKEEMQRKMRYIEHITHVFFFAYTMDEDPEVEAYKNTLLLRNAISVIESLSNLKFVVLGTGGKVYGSHLPGFPHGNPLPLRETLPRISSAPNLFYYHQVDALRDMCAGKVWTWCEIRPDLVVGFVPHNNFYCLAQVLATYLSLYASLNGPGAQVPFPGGEKSWTSLSQDSSQDVIAKASIYASLHPERSSQESFNVADDATPWSWSNRWPIICSYFGLQGVGPTSKARGPQPSEYLADHVDDWRSLEIIKGLQPGRVIKSETHALHAHAMMTLADQDRQMDLSKCYRLMGDAKTAIGIKESWWKAFDRFREARIIP
ncbi:unnamed protein product [Clonostachys byssicola]|uniref:PRISE-like Rossmann-fold domain-containing protein n=1 Tax=Clonostachys byssicola TaxID=160290 RepID=A0A9N9XW32_9HYPO|nr:unnamed protein product [Clonostachys byssicola]